MQSASTNITTFPGKVGISNANPTHTLAIGSNVYVDDTGSNKLTVTGVISGDGLGVSNIQTANVLGLTDNVTRIATLETDLDNNSTRITNLSSNLSDNSSRITALESEDITVSGVKTFEDDIILESNLRVKGDLTYANTVNMIVSDPIIELGANNQHTNDLGLVLTRHGNSGNDSNVSIFYDESEDNLKIGYTDDSASQTTLTTTATGLDVSITGNVAAAYDTDETSYFGRAAVGYMGQSDQASFSHIDKNTSANFALKQAASGATHLNTPTGQHIRFSVNATEVGRFTGGGDFKVGANKLLVEPTNSTVSMYSQDTGSTAGPDLVLMRNNPNNGANNEYIGQIRYEGLNDDGNSLLYAKTTGKIKTATKNSEDGVIETMIKTGGSNRISVRHSGDKFLITNGTDLQVGEVANLYVDTSTSRVGIGLSNPSYKLDVSGDINFTGSLLQNGSAFQGSKWTTTGTAVYRPSGNVGIGVAPSYKLDVSGDINFTGSLLQNGSAFQGSKWSTSGSNIYRSSGSVGIGTNNPTTGGYQLHVYTSSGANTGIRIESSPTSGTLESKLNIKSSGATAPVDWWMWNNGSDTKLRFYGSTNGWTGYTTNDDHMVIDTSGNVGIGTASPKNKLDVRSDNYATFGKATYNAAGWSGIRLGTPYTTNHDAYCSVIESYNNHASDYNSDLRFKTSNGNNAAATERMRITSAGNVGIGTANPYVSLHIHGGNFAIEYGRAIVCSPNIPIASGGWPNGTNKLIETGWGQGDEVRFFTPGSQSGTQKMVINSHGRVGIGLASPSYKLDVSGDINFTGTLYQNGSAFSGGGSSAWTTSGSNAYRTSGNIGIGTSTMGAQLHILKNNSSLGAGIILARNTTEAGAIWHKYINDPTLSQTEVLCFRTVLNRTDVYGGTPMMVINDRGNVGIGTQLPCSSDAQYGSSGDFRGLHLYAPGNQAQIEIQTGASGYDAQLRMKSTTASWLIRASGSSNKYLTFGSNYGTCAGFRGDSSRKFAVGTSYASSRLEIKASSNNDYNEGIRFSNSSGYWWAWGPDTSTSSNSSISNIIFSFQGTNRGYINWSSGGGQVNFTGQHRTFVKDIPHTVAINYEGMIVSADQNKYIKMSGGIAAGSNAITTNESLPIVSLTTKVNDKKCFGVISASEDPETRENSFGNFVSVEDKEYGDTRVFINSVGEGAIWVTDINGPLESGDYITTSNVTGYGQKQTDDVLHNYTVAKITMDCDFEPATQPVQIIKKQLGTVKYWVKAEYNDIEYEEYLKLAEDRRRTIPTIAYSNGSEQISSKAYNNLESNAQAAYSEIESVGYQHVLREESTKNKDDLAQDGWTSEVREEMVNVLNEHNEIQWEDHATETEKVYKIRYLDADGKITTEANKVYTAAFVGCTYHCG